MDELLRTFPFLDPMACRFKTWQLMIVFPLILFGGLLFIGACFKYLFPKLWYEGDATNLPINLTIGDCETPIVDCGSSKCFAGALDLTLNKTRVCSLALGQFADQASALFACRAVGAMGSNLTVYTNTDRNECTFASQSRTVNVAGRDLFVVTIILASFVIGVILVHVVRIWWISSSTASANEQPIDGYQNVEEPGAEA